MIQPWTDLDKIVASMEARAEHDWRDRLRTLADGVPVG